MDICHLDQENHLGGDHRAPNFYNGIQFERNIEGERENLLLLVLEEVVVVVVEDRPDRAEAKTKDQTILRQRHRKSPDRQSLVETC